jgi:hypothetical protein
MTDRPLRDDADERPEVPAELVERIATPLREPVTLDEEFEGRVMRAVRASSSGRPAPGWWQRGYTLRVTPATALALAAGLALAAVLGRMTASTRGNAVPTVTAAAPAAAHDTVYVVRFTLVHPDARRVSLVGDFNGWTADATPLAGQSVAGVWSASVPVTPGRHEYAFIVDGQRWVADPYAATVHDEFGTSSSVVHVGDARDESATSIPAI